MKTHAETKELLLAVAKIWKRQHEEKMGSRTGKIGKWAWITIVAKSFEDIYEACEGIAEIPAEAADFTEEEMTDLYESFCGTLEWTPSDDTRDKAFLFFKSFMEAVLLGILFKNTYHPPRAEIVP